MSFLGLVYWVVLIVCIVFGFVTMQPNSPYARYSMWPATVLFIIIGIELFSRSVGLH